MAQSSFTTGAEGPGVRGTWVQLTLEAVIFLGIGALLVLVARQIPLPRADAGFVFAMLIVMHGCGLVGFAQRAADFLELECPHCSHSFHGYPDRVPRPFRTRCARCGAPS